MKALECGRVWSEMMFGGDVLQLRGHVMPASLAQYLTFDTAATATHMQPHPTALEGQTFVVRVWRVGAMAVAAA